MPTLDDVEGLTSRTNDWVSFIVRPRTGPRCFRQLRRRLNYLAWRNSATAMRTATTTPARSSEPPLLRIWLP